eukprot:c16476_g1_i1 orf=868-1533(+)
MWRRYSSFKMRGRNDGSQRKRFAFSMCLMLVTLSLICIYYGSFFKSALRHKSGSSFVEGDEELIARRFGNEADEDSDTDETGLKSGDDGEVLDKEGAKITGRKQETIKTAQDSAFDMSIKTFPVCDSRHSELIPCLDRHLNSQLKLKLNLSVMEHYERHCPPSYRRLNCLIPPPPNYKVPIGWPASRDEVWQSNVPHTFLAMEKSDQHWMIVNGDKVNFPG